MGLLKTNVIFGPPKVIEFIEDKTSWFFQTQRISFIKGDDTKEYTIAYKTIADQNPNKDYEILNPITRFFWLPLLVTDINGKQTWILLNKNSLKKRLNISNEELESFKNNIAMPINTKTKERLENEKAERAQNIRKKNTQTKAAELFSIFSTFS